MKHIMLCLFLTAASVNAYSSQMDSCNVTLEPKILQTIENWSIITNNVAQINTAPNFNGPMLVYTISSKNVNPENKLTINEVTGELTVDARVRDNFDVEVTASNNCGKASNTFNIQIDEEE